MQFQAEIKEVKSRKTASLDNVYRIVLETNDSNLMTLGMLPADTLVSVSVESENG